MNDYLKRVINDILSNIQAEFDLPTKSKASDELAMALEDVNVNSTIFEFIDEGFQE